MIQIKRDKSARTQVLVTSIIFNGLSHVLYFKQYLKGIILMLLEVIMIVLSPTLCNALLNMVLLGETDTAVSIAQRDNSAFMLVDGIGAVFILGIYVAIYIYYINDALGLYEFYCGTGLYKNSNKTLMESIRDSFCVWGMLPGILLVIGLVLLPLVFAFLAAFTNLSAPANIAPSKNFDWVGLDNFIALFGGDMAWTSAFFRVLLWTLVFAAASTALCYVGGLVMAHILHRYRFRFNKGLQVILMLPYAIPAVVSMLVWRNLLNGSFGVVNRTLMAWGVINDPIPWLSDPFMAKVTCIAISLWAGYSYFMLLILTTMNTISPAIYDAAAMDGAGRGTAFRKLVLPLIVQRTTPFIVLAFTQNMNNFTTVFFLTEGNPALANTTTTSAGGTDLLVTWIYNLTFNLMKFNYASVITVVLFVVLVPIAVWQFKKTGMYRREQ